MTPFVLLSTSTPSIIDGIHVRTQIENPPSRVLFREGEIPVLVQMMVQMQSTAAQIGLVLEPSFRDDSNTNPDR